MAAIPKLKAIMWAAFTLGGIVAAFLIPVLIVITNLAVPFGLIPAGKFDYSRLFLNLSSPLVMLPLAAILVASLYHAAYRLQSALEEVMLGKLPVVSWIIAYGLLAFGLGLLLYALLVIPWYRLPSFPRII